MKTLIKLISAFLKWLFNKKKKSEKIVNGFKKVVESLESKAKRALNLPKISDYNKNLNAFRKLKEENKIRIFRATKTRIERIIDKNKIELGRNKQGIPCYPVKKAPVLEFS